MRTARNRLALLLCAVLAAGCSDSDVKEVKQWMKSVEARAKVSVPPIGEPKKFIPFAYTAGEMLDPYNPNKLAIELARLAKATNNPFKPDLERRKELLESFPLDTIKMVGIIQKGGTNYALLQIDRSVYQVKRGMRLGQNFGLVMEVNEEAIEIKENVQDASGEWVERMSKLELQDSKETKK